MFAKKKGYRVERKIRKMFENDKWKVVRAGAEESTKWGRHCLRLSDVGDTTPRP